MGFPLSFFKARTAGAFQPAEQLSAEIRPVWKKEKKFTLEIISFKKKNRKKPFNFSKIFSVFKKWFRDLAKNDVILGDVILGHAWYKMLLTGF